MRWRDYGKRLIQDKKDGLEFFMLDDIIYSFIQKNDGVDYDAICRNLSEKSGICLEDCIDNADAILEYLERNRQILYTSSNRYIANPDAPGVLSPLQDGIGADPDKLIVL